MKRRICPACGYHKSSHWFNINKYNILKCIYCGTLFVENIPTDDKLEKIYQDSNYYHLNDESIFRINKENQRRLINIQKIIPNGKLLDIGCASGLFLDKAKQLKYQTYGVEQSYHNAKLASDKGHIVFNGNLDNFFQQDLHHKFDVVVCLDVIEHVIDPANFLKLIVSCMKSNGILVLSTPNYSGVISKILKQKDPFLIPPEHLNFFTYQGIMKLGEKYNLNILKRTTFGNLTDSEFKRSMEKYFPNIILPFSFAIKPLIRLFFYILNKMRLGLELEIYFSYNNSYKN